MIFYYNFSPCLSQEWKYFLMAFSILDVSRQDLLPHALGLSFLTHIKTPKCLCAIYVYDKPNSIIRFTILIWSQAKMWPAMRGRKTLRSGMRSVIGSLVDWLGLNRISRNDFRIVHGKGNFRTIVFNRTFLRCAKMIRQIFSSEWKYFASHNNERVFMKIELECRRNNLLENLSVKRLLIFQQYNMLGMGVSGGIYDVFETIST